MSSAPTPATSTRRLLLGIGHHLSQRRRGQLGVLLLVMLASGVAELLSLAAVVPFLGVLSDPQQLWQHKLIQSLAIRLGYTSASQLLVPATVAFALAAVLAAVIRLANLWLNGQLASAIGSDLSCEAYRRTLHQPYRVQVQRNSSDLITTISQQTSRAVVALNAVFQLCTAAVVAAGLMVALLAVDWAVALGSAAVFGAAYGLMAVTVRLRLANNSRLIEEASRQQLKALQEGLGAIRDVLLDASQSTFEAIFRSSDHSMRQGQAQNEFLGTFPRYALEGLGLVLIAVLGLMLVMQRGSGAGVIPMLGALALGAQRLLPALQLIYDGWANLRGHGADLAAVLSMLEQPMPRVFPGIAPLLLRDGIRMEAVHFRYGSELEIESEQPEVLRGLDLEIRWGERIGLIGSTGSGKSTTVDLLMGLLEPTSGRILVDGVDLHEQEHPERLAAWRATIAHVPQSIYLADSTIAENIGFGLPKGQFDPERIRDAAQRAQIASFIESLPAGYNSIVGEQGIRLSGGQRQRIGIARALYRRAQVLVLDEATAALDNATEQAVMEAVEALSRELTIVMIAHRLSTVARCDRVIRLSEGAVTLDGPPQLVLA